MESHWTAFLREVKQVLLSVDILKYLQYTMEKSDPVPTEAISLLR